MSLFQKAQRSQVFLKLAITGPSGSGKTLSALRLATGLTSESGNRIGLIDTENDSASLYADLTEGQCKSFGIPAPLDFDVCGIAPPFEAIAFDHAIKQAVKEGYGAVVIDSASHLWKGILAYKGDIDARGGNQWTNWREPDKKFQDAIDSVLQSKIHVIFCMRSKTEYILEDNGKGKQAPRKVGLAPIMKDGLEFEFSAVLDVQMDHRAQSSKDRTGLFPSDKIFQINEDTGREVLAWLKTATPKAEATPKPESSDEEAKAKNIAAFRKWLVSNQAPAMPGFEELFCAKLCEFIIDDGKSRITLEDFSRGELKSLWEHREVALKEAKSQADALTPRA